MSFSVPRCNRPMWGSHFFTDSPLSSMTRRSTPWAAGCWGPKLRVRLETSLSAGGSLSNRRYWKKSSMQRFWFPFQGICCTSGHKHLFNIGNTACITGVVPFHGGGFHLSLKAVGYITAPENCSIHSTSGCHCFCLEKKQKPKKHQPEIRLCYKWHCHVGKCQPLASVPFQGFKNEKILGSATSYTEVWCCWNILKKTAKNVSGGFYFQCQWEFVLVNVL